LALTFLRDVLLPLFNALRALMPALACFSMSRIFLILLGLGWPVQK
jgi:hypothetical protein